MALSRGDFIKKNLGLENRWSSWVYHAIIQKQKGTVDLAGGTPPDWEDYLIGADGNGLWCDIREPRPDDLLIALAANVTLTHAIEVRYDKRIKEEMQAKFWFEDEYHTALIKTVVDEGFNHIYMLLGCVEEKPLGEAYQ